ncbi:MAG: phospholipase [Dehalococcoidia bacterium]|nr:phospholipase [Dehalococcoidia bacterium]
MRRSSILPLLLCALVVFGGTVFGGTVVTGTSTASAAEGDPRDFCSYSPDYPFGWSFNEACEGHDTCIVDLPDAASLLERLACDDGFFADLLDSSHLGVDRVCEDSPVCSFLARMYYRVVRYVTLLTWGGEDALRDLPGIAAPLPGGG